MRSSTVQLIRAWGLAPSTLLVIHWGPGLMGPAALAAPSGMRQMVDVIRLRPRAMAGIRMAAERVFCGTSLPKMSSKTIRWRSLDDQGEAMGRVLGSMIGAEAAWTAWLPSRSA